MPLEKQTWSIIIPCYNEKDNIEKVVNDVLVVLKNIAEKYEVIIIDDGSTDGSLKSLNR